VDEPGRRYCLFMDGSKYDRNAGCRAHDNAYGIYGGGTEADRRTADMRFFRHMRTQGDPLALLVLVAVRVWGWFFFNYHGRPWRGQLIRKIFPGY
jgi:hypothetical protein